MPREVWWGGKHWETMSELSAGSMFLAGERKLLREGWMLAAPLSMAPILASVQGEGAGPELLCRLWMAGETQQGAVRAPLDFTMGSQSYCRRRRSLGGAVSRTSPALPPPEAILLQVGSAGSCGSLRTGHRAQSASPQICQTLAPLLTVGPGCFWGRPTSPHGAFLPLPFTHHRSPSSWITPRHL